MSNRFSWPPRPNNRRGFEIAIICALPLEADAVEALFDHHWDDDGPPFDKEPGDPNAYSTGVIGRHNVILAYMPGMGIANAAAVSSNCRASFPCIRLALVVGVCVVVPFSPVNGEILLGDVIISNGIVQYDFGRQLPDRFVRKDTLLDSLGRPNQEIRAVLAKLGSLRHRRQLSAAMAGYLDVLLQDPELRAEYPGTPEDKLFEASYRHTESQKSCEQLGCNGVLVSRSRLEAAVVCPTPAVHFGLMASGNSVIKSGEDRDRIAAEEGIIAFEMEGAGVWDSFPCIVVKSACDYADSHKSKVWQRYAAATAAACTKALLSFWVPSPPLDNLRSARNVETDLPPNKRIRLHPPEGVCPARDSRDQTVSLDNTPKRQEWLRKLYVCPYRDRKDRNPQRVEGTCKWFTNHPLFRNWQESAAASLLWVSADPGCGKSVLAKYLTDEAIPSTMTRMTCYFFFKEDFEDQRSLVTALCSILHQIFDHHPASFSTEILKMFEDKGAILLTSFSDLWDILIAVTNSHRWKEIVCIFDALDECEVAARHQLIEAISKFYSGTTTRPALKLLLTSRPYLDIWRGFYPLVRELPTIHLSGENEEEIDKISREIDLVVGSRVADVGGRLGLLQEEQHVLLEELTRVPNRTYLWLHLILDIIINSIIDRIEDIPSIVKTIPKTVDAAYDRILSKSPDVEQARKLLHIIVAAVRPLTLQEMALALAIKPHHRSISDLKLGPEDRICHNIRQHCGLFVVVVDSKVYLLHQTAREFLVPPLSHRPSLGPHLNSTTLQWKYSLHPRKSNRILTEICMLRLSLSDFSLRSLQANPRPKQYIADRILLGYAARFWTDHFRDSDWENSDGMVKKAFSYCNPKLSGFLTWLEIYNTLANGFRPQNFTPLVVACYFGLTVLVQQLLEDGADANVKDEDHMMPLHFASQNGHDTVVQRLLEGGADANAKSDEGWTPLHFASEDGYDAVVQRLLEAGVDANVKGHKGWTPLHFASLNGHDAVVQRLLEGGADANVKDEDRMTPLHLASQNSRDMVVQRLLEGGADVNVKDHKGWTPLHFASLKGHDAVVQRLLEGGADTNVKDDEGWMPLHFACKYGRDAVVQRLLEGGADANVKDEDHMMPLHFASQNSRDMVVQRLLEAGADANAKGDEGWIPLHFASQNGHDTVVQRLLEGGADAIAKGDEGWMPLHFACKYGRDAVVQQLLEGGADANVKDEYGRTPLHLASLNGHDAVVQQLLEDGADANVKDKYGMTPLHFASEDGHDAVVQRLLEAGTDANAKDHEGWTPLRFASENGHDTVVQQLQLSLPTPGGIGT